MRCGYSGVETGTDRDGGKNVFQAVKNETGSKGRR